jgi:hypothetical protein
MELPPLTAEPALLSFSSLSTDKNHWWNQEMAQFYGKEYIVVVAEP